MTPGLTWNTTPKYFRYFPVVELKNDQVNSLETGWRRESVHGESDDCFVKRPKLEWISVPRPLAAHPYALQRSSQFHGLNTEVFAADSTLVSTRTHDVGNNNSHNCLSMKTWENVENLKDCISLEGWTGKEQTFDDEAPEKIPTCNTWDNVDEGYVYFDSSNFNFQNVDFMDVERLAEADLYSGMLENLETVIVDDDPKKTQIITIDDDPEKIGYSCTSTCKTRQNGENWCVSYGNFFKDGAMDVEARARKEQNRWTQESTMDDHSSENMKKGSSDGIGNDGMDEDLDVNGAPESDDDEMQNSEKMPGVSLAEFFTQDEIRKHLSSLKQSDDSENTGDVVCDLCSKNKLYFDPVPLYCSNCERRIKPDGHYYVAKDENSLGPCLCPSCHKLAMRRKRNLPRTIMDAQNMSRETKDAETEEPWVQCDKCKKWQHQICALYDHNRDLEGKAAYICPQCLLNCARRKLEPRLAAKDLPTTMLSDHIEKRLLHSLDKDRKLRAEMAGKNVDEVQGVENLFVRVVSSVQKQLKVKECFWNIFKEKNCPIEFPYRSKAIVVFQNIEGVDVCIFAMYVQEFGLDCAPQNRRSVCIAYIDSVKHFTPDTVTIDGEALRTFVYHQVLIASLEFFKKRGFASCYLWSCPPTKGEDYIFYGHPKNQKTPKPDKLNKWYQSMLKKADKEGIVVNVTNLYDHFFVTSGVSSKLTATRLPYFEGDYWTKAGEDIIKSLEENKDGVSNLKGGRKVKEKTPRALGYGKPSNSSMDDEFMQKLGDNILSSKEDFLIIQLQFFCKRCDEAILSGKRWFCSKCPTLQLCERCHGTTRQGRNRSDTHTSINMEKHKLSRVEVDIPFIQADNDVVVENNIFDDRQSFMDFCQNNRHQFDTLRRAKHSSMIILNDLHDKISTTVRKLSLLRQLLQVAQHLSECIKKDPSQCSSLHCMQMRKMFRHWLICKTHPSGGCGVCKKASILIKAHSRRCQDSECRVPLCKDVKNQFSFNSHTKPMPKDGTAIQSH